MIMIVRINHDDDEDRKNDYRTHKNTKRTLIQRNWMMPKVVKRKECLNKKIRQS